MNLNFLMEKLKELGIFSREEYEAEAFSRNLGLLTQKEQDRLAAAKIGIPGMGGVGGVHFMTMVRTGVGRFHISDFDVYEPANVNRQFGARVPDFGRPKIEVMKEQALSVNPFIEIKEFPEGINEDTVDAFLEGVDVVLDSLDFFAFDVRRLLFIRAREKDVHVITAGPLGFSSAMLIFAPDKGMEFDEYFNIMEDMKPEEQYLSFALGLAPKATQFKYMDTGKLSFKSRKGPSLNIACQLCSAMAGTEAVRIILNHRGVRPVPYYFQFDLYSQKYYRRKLNMGNKNPWQQVKFRMVKHMFNKNAVIGPEEPDMPSGDIKDGIIFSEILEYIIKAGIQAPSGDNSQPWKFSYKGNAITLYLDEARDQSFFNVAQTASVISCGAVVENMKIAASGFGLDSKVEYDFDQASGKIALLTFFSDKKTEKDPLADYIWKRKTNRKLFKKEAVPLSLLDELKSSITRIEGTDVHFITDKHKLNELARIVAKADRIRTERQDLHEHLIQMIRFSLNEAFEEKDGFYIKNLEAGTHGELFLRIAKSWPVMNFFNKLGFGKIVAQTAYKGIINSSGAALVVNKGKERKDFFQGGRALERIWLNFSKAGFYIQPMTAITLFFMRKQLEGDKNFSQNHSQMLDKLWDQYKILFPDVNLNDYGQVMLFRFGKAEDIQYCTLRRQDDMKAL